MTVEKAVTQTMDTFWAHHEAGDFQKGLEVADQFGYRDDVMEFVFDPDSYFVPNRRGDRFVRPGNVSRDKIPVIGLLDKEDHVFESPTTHRLQRIALRASGIQIPPVERQFAEYAPIVRSSGKGPDTASVLVHAAEHDGRSYIQSSPNLLLNMEEDHNGVKLACTGIILHELIHIAQTLSEPVRSPSYAVQAELEAYAVQATLLYSYTVPYSLNTAMAATVDQFRQKNLGKNLYVPTPPFVEAMRSDDHVSKIIPVHYPGV